MHLSVAAGASQQWPSQYYSSLSVRDNGITPRSTAYVAIASQRHPLVLMGSVDATVVTGLTSEWYLLRVSFLVTMTVTRCHPCPRMSWYVWQFDAPGAKHPLCVRTHTTDSRRHAKTHEGANRLVCRVGVCGPARGTCLIMDTYTFRALSARTARCALCSHTDNAGCCRSGLAWHNHNKTRRTASWSSWRRRCRDLSHPSPKTSCRSSKPSIRSKQPLRASPADTATNDTSQLCPPAVHNSVAPGRPARSPVAVLRGPTAHQRCVQPETRRGHNSQPAGAGGCKPSPPTVYFRHHHRAHRRSVIAASCERMAHQPQAQRHSTNAGSNHGSARGPAKQTNTPGGDASRPFPR